MIGFHVTSATGAAPSEIVPSHAILPSANDELLAKGLSLVALGVIGFEVLLRPDHVKGGAER